MFCPNCGQKTELGAKFCSSCGHLLTNKGATNHQNENPVHPHDEQTLNPYNEEIEAQHFKQPEDLHEQQSGFSQQSQEQYQFDNPQLQQQHGSQRYNQPPTPKKNMKVWIISGVAAFIIIVLAVSYGLFTYFNGQNNAKPDDNQKVEQVVKSGIENNEENEDKNVTEQKPDTNEKENKEEKEKEVAEEKEKTQIIKESMPKVFTIITQDGHGSGFLYEDGGYIVTNAHVVAGYSDVLVRNSAGQESPGRVIGISDTSDIALIYSEDYEDTDPLPMESNSSDVGIEVIAIGSPQGFENSASIGYLTGTDREMSIDGYNFVYDELYQIDAQIDQGSSGGPLFDATTGNVIGINSLVYLNYQSFAFAIPLYTVKEQFDEWIENPMSDTDVVAVDVYAGYETEESDLGEDYSEFWDMYDQYAEEYSEDENGMDGLYDEYMDSYGYYFDEESLSSFITSFFEYYEWSINDGDFYWIQDMISPESNAYYDLEQQITDYYGSNLTFDYWYTEITGIDIFEDYAIVTTYEEYDLYEETGEYTTYSENVEYYVVIDENGYYLISEIYYEPIE